MKQKKNSESLEYPRLVDVLTDEMKVAYDVLVDLRRDEKDEEFFEALERFRQVGKDRGEPVYEAEASFQLGKYYERLHQYGQALRLFKEALATYTNLGMLSSIALVASNIGTTYSPLRLFHDAVANFRIAYTTAIRIGDNRIAAVALASMGNNFLHLHQYEQGLSYILESIPLAESTKDKPHISYAYLLLGNAYQQCGKYEDALFQYHRSLSIREELGNKMSIAVALNNIGNTFVLMKCYEDALTNFNRSLKYKEEYESPTPQINTLCGIATCYMHIGNSTEALFFAKKALNIAEQTTIAQHLCHTKEILAKIHERLGDTTTALQYYKEYHRHYEEDISADNRQRYQELVVAFELDRKEQQAEIERLRTEQLSKEIAHKSKELTTLALHLAQKNEMLAKLKDRLEEIRENEAQEGTSLNRIENEIQSSLSGDKSWQMFEQQFKTIHHDFVQRLTRQCSELSPTELRLCALLKINLSSKEIANILCIAPKSIEIYRFRIRKKLRLKKAENLTTYLAAL